MADQVPGSEAVASDGALVRRIAAGDQEALGALFDRYGRPAFALATRITGNPELAEDVVHEVFLRLWRDPSRYDPARGGFPGWLLAATHHLALGATRRQSAARQCREALAAELASRGAPATPSGGRGNRTSLALAALPAAQRQALVLAYFAGHTQSEIATDTDVPLGTVRARMVSGMRQLRVLLDGTPDEPGVQP
jgi:RNA polymerase sigma factor (sigma-70 family)